ncbi:putative Ubiquitin, Ubiquitin subgroup protein [Pseudoloma neurophilia]|uniref:Putative Ubiquitin, Ubiquitin subgroup protein n=1 Tax=Pseudoloma neurophilia TaxID=146866 RepID=A0A0R0M603_9MICR|nr:putative Ubiquitin, Ubiquitin subgroup protein [Pseudoloma neurophilia]
MLVKVRLLNDPTPHSFDIPSDSTILSLKQLIEKQTEISTDQQKFIFSGKILTTGKLKDNGVTEGVVIQMVLALRGG